MMQSPQNFLRKYWAECAVIGITILALGIRLYNLTFQCYNVDEIFTAQVAANTSLQIIHWSLSVDCNPPLYYLAAHWSSVLLGSIDQFSIRIPAVIFSVLAIPVVYLTGKELRNTTLGLLAAASMTIMFPFFFYSQDGRAYTFVLLAFLCFTYFYIKIVKGDTRTRILVAAGFFAAVCLWSHYYSAIPLVIAILLLFTNKQKLAALEVSVITGLLLLPMVLFINIPNLLSRAAPWVFGATYQLGTTPQAMAISPGNMILYLPFELWSYSCLVIVPLALFALWKYRGKVFRYFAIITLGSMTVLVILSHFTNALPRYALLISPLFILMALYPVSEIIDNQNRVSKKIAIALLFLFLIFIFNIMSIISWTTYNICYMVN